MKPADLPDSERYLHGTHARYVIGHADRFGGVARGTSSVTYTIEDDS